MTLFGLVSGTLFGVFFGHVSELAVRVVFVLPSWPLLGVQDGRMSALWLSSCRFGQLGGTKTMVKYSVFVAFSKSTRTADAQPLGARLGVLLCLLLAFGVPCNRFGQHFGAKTEPQNRSKK